MPRAVSRLLELAGGLVVQIRIVQERATIEEALAQISEVVQ